MKGLRPLSQPQSADNLFYPMSSQSYSEKLLDPRWQKKRLTILSRDEWTCQHCGDTKTTLHVHHELYEGNNPWDTDEVFLTTLCEECHSIERLGFTALEKFLLQIVRVQNRDDTKYIKHINKHVKKIKSES